MSAARARYMLARARSQKATAARSWASPSAVRPAERCDRAATGRGHERRVGERRIDDLGITRAAAEVERAAAVGLGAGEVAPRGSELRAGAVRGRLHVVGETWVTNASRRANAASASSQSPLENA